MNPPVTLWQRITRASGALAMGQTFTYYAAFIALGLTTAILGPSLLGLAEQTGSALSQVGLLFTARSFGYMLGSFMGGRLLDRLPAHRTMGLAVLVIALLLGSIPFVPILVVLMAIVFVIGLMEAVIDVGANTLIVWVHREGVGPYMNGLHLFFAVGAFLSPLLVAQAIVLTGNFRWGVWIVAVLLLPLVLRFLPLPNPPPIVSHHEHANVRPDSMLVLLVALFLLFVAGAEISYSGWIATYVVRTGIGDLAAGAYVTSGFWGAFTIARIGSIPIAVRVRPRVIIIVDLILSLIGIAIVIAFPASPLALWGGTILFGLGVASTFPTILTFAGRHMVITGAVTGLFFGGASLGNMLTPTLISQLFDSVGPVSLLWVVGAMVVLSFAVFAAILWKIGAIGRSKAENDH